MIVDYADKALTQRYQLMAQTIIPRPIAWIVTENEKGIINIAPFSYFMGLSSKPATMIVSIGHKSDGSEKDTLKNIKESKKCTICMVDEEHLESMHFSSKELRKDESEANAFDIKTTKIFEDFPPMVEDVPSAFFCEFYQEIELKGSKTIPLVVEIKQQFIDDEIITNREKITLEYAPVARVGKSYALLGEQITPPKIP
ncbi:flavin reductase family protein [Sulfurimonas paralvinellae]|uniref:Flavin reductase family protein n=1 Tax=Sulfurimonas paralvinellae TaxID=317658 RepID=A0A7M1B9N2_9BACT|nr:flavin reductase family protein [Sulfurimonas paralvinellae]QOP46413.1 flavin reductase family protein [Sulfurimonas paralvinellae]